MSSPAQRPTDNRPPLRVALFGCGKMGLHHLKAIKASGIADVVGVADPAANAEELTAVAGAQLRVFASAAELLAATRPDVVHIVTPPGSHADLAVQALDAGCHVYVEKPFTPTVVEARRVLAAAAERDLLVCPGHQVLFERPALAARDALSKIGRVVHVESYFSFKMVRRTITQVEQAKDILPHAVYPVVDQLRLGTGIENEPIEVVGVTATAGGDVYALLRLGPATAVVVVTLSGRPVEQYQSIVGTNGSLRPDYIGGGMAELVGPGTGPGVLLTPYRRSLQTLTGTTSGVTRLIMGGSYPGLRLLIKQFYLSVRDGQPSPLSPQSILDTVATCERIGLELDRVEEDHEKRAHAALREREAALVPARGPIVLVTGGTGLLGQRTVEELRAAGYPVRVIARRTPPPSRRVPGVEYAAGDLARGVDPILLQDVGVVVHSAAETAGGQSDHQRNSVDATRNILTTAAHAGVRKFIHISSIGILKSSREVGGALDEASPVDGNARRGPYVWGKAQSEHTAVSLGAELGVDVKVIRPGPLVDYNHFHPPGRLGRELGPLFVAMGPRNGVLSVCDVSTAAAVIRSYVGGFQEAPAMLNLVEAPGPKRRELMDRLLKHRPDLKVFWFPAFLLRLISGPARLLQRVALGSKQPVDIASAFASERYRTDLAASVIRQAQQRQPASAAMSHEPVGR